MPRLTADQWAGARIKWEADPTLTFEALGMSMSVSREAVGQRARKEGWQRRTDLRTLAELAHARSDSREAAKKLPQLLPGELPAGSIKTRELAVDLRADVIDRHKADAAAHRARFGPVPEDFEEGKHAKISMEMLAIRHKVERDAYGLNEVATQQAPAEPDWAVLIGQRVTVEVAGA